MCQNYFTFRNTILFIVKEYEDDLNALRKLPPEEQPGYWKSSWRKQTLERRRVEAKYEALRDITRDLRTDVVN